MRSNEDTFPPKHRQAFKGLGGELFNELSHRRRSKVLGSRANEHGMRLAQARDLHLPKSIGRL